MTEKYEVKRTSSQSATAGVKGPSKTSATRSVSRPNLDVFFEKFDEYFADKLKDKGLIDQFFLAFSRFEYALKRAGYAKIQGKAVAADWRKFANERGHLFSAGHPDVKSGVHYILSRPPKTQTIVDKKLDWVETKRGEDQTDMEWLLQLVKIVRNNLFHGGKFPYRSVPDPSRNTHLLTGCLAIIDACVDLDPTVREHFFDPLE